MKQILLMIAVLALVGCVESPEEKVAKVKLAADAKVIEAAIRKTAKKPAGELTKANLESYVTTSSNTGKNKSSWKDILGAPKGVIPPDPGGKVVWRSDLNTALAQAKSSKRPILVTWRCLPCKQCAEFDKDVLDGSPSLDPFLRRFVTVRLTDAAFLDERYFPYKTHQDLDLSWWAYFLSSEGEYYGVFGGKDHVSDATRISEAALVKSMERILGHHYDPRRKKWAVDLPVGYASPKKSVPMDLKGYDLLGKIRPELSKPFQAYGACVHCHEVGDMLNMEALDSGTFNLERFTSQWPLPENVGILLDRDNGLLVKRITVGSPAALSGIKAGDQLAMANGMRLYSQADFRGVLHRSSHAGDSIQLFWLRNGQAMAGNIRVRPGWRKTENSWRKTVYDGVYGPGMGFFPLKGQLAGKGQGLSIKPWMGPTPVDRPVYKTGLRPHMEIVSINGMNKDTETRKLIAWFRLNHKPGQTVTYKIRGGKEFKYVLPKD